jgi:uncharacterized protein (TIGR02266 family)
MSEDSRDSVRVRKTLEFEYRCDGQTTTARIEDISEGGAFVDTPNPHSVDEQLEFKLKLPGEDVITGKARVRWQQPTIGMGIEFVGLSDTQREAIKFYVASEFFQSFSDG